MIFQIDEKNIDSEFERLSKLILLQKELNVNDESFRFTEIEFYYYSKNHQDAFTHKHDYPSGKWRFHNQGFDITLRGDTGFGGILIRGIEFKGDNTNGPRRVLFEIMKYLNPVTEPNNYLGLQDRKPSIQKIFRTFRHGLNKPISDLKCNNPDFFREANYRFIINPQSFKKNQFKGAEKIARSFNNKVLSYEILGYNLK